MGCWDDYCVICGGAARVNQAIEEALADLLSRLQSPTVASDLRKLRLNEADTKFAEDLVLVGPFDESLHPIISNEAEPSTVPPVSGTPWVLVAGEELMQYPAEEIRVIEGITMGGMLLGDLKRTSDGKFYSCNSNVYPFLHARCLRLLNDCTLIKTPQQFWQVMRACNGTEWQLQGLRGIDYGEIKETQDQFVWCFSLLQVDDYQEWLKYFVFKSKLDEDDIQRFYNGVGWLWTTPDRFPINATIIAQKERSFLELERISMTSVQEADNASLTGIQLFARLPLDVVLLVTQNLDLASFLQLSAVNRETLQALLLHGNSTIYVIIEKTRPWCLPYGEMEQKSWKEMLEEGRITESFPWLLYARECAANSHSMRNRRRIWKIMEQLEAVAIKNDFISV